jgi:hypothetical protein
MYIVCNRDVFDLLDGKLCCSLLISHHSAFFVILLLMHWCCTVLKVVVLLSMCWYGLFAHETCVDCANLYV